MIDIHSVERTDTVVTMNKYDKYGQPLERAVPMTPAELAEKAAQDMQDAYEDAVEAAELVRMSFVHKFPHLRARQ